MKEGNTMKHKGTQLKNEVQNLKNISDDDIDYSDIPDTTNFENLEIGKFYRPLKKRITVRIDADIIDWLKKTSPVRGYQTKLNQVLREYKDSKLA